MHIKMSSAICSNFDQSKILSSGNGLTYYIPKAKGSYTVSLDQYKNPIIAKPRLLREKQLALVTSIDLFSLTLIDHVNKTQVRVLQYK